MKNIEKNIKFVLHQIYAAEQKYRRNKGSVQLLAVSKTHSVNLIEKAISAGLVMFGENYLQQALPKIEALSQYHPIWHFIGPVQSNKTRQIAENFDWVLSVDKEKTAKRLAEARPQERGPLNVCIQVNISQELTKTGTTPSDVYDLAAKISALPGIKLRGIMGIPAPTKIVKEQRSSFRKLSDVFNEVIHRGIDMDTLSMGMSNDLDSAIAEGATLVRVGTAIFGERN